MNGTNRNGSGNGVHKDAAIVNGHDPVSSDLLWDGLSPAVANALEQPLDPGLVSQRKGRAGRTYSYIEGHTVIAQANRIFGFGGWGFELAGDVTLRRIENVDPKTGDGDAHPRLQRPRARHRPRRSAPHRRRLPHGG